MNDVELTRLSQLCDGELDNETMVQVLLDVFDGDHAQAESRTEAQQVLCDLLRLRQTTAAWRNREAESLSIPSTSTPTSASPSLAEFSRPRPASWRSTSVYVAIAASCACLLLLGVVVGQYLQGGGSSTSVKPVAEGSAEIEAPAKEVPAERRRQLAEVFAFHESIIGPLRWYAAGEDAENLAIAGGEPQSAPVGLVLRFTTKGPQPESQEYVIVCRDRSSASINLPGSGPGEEPVQIRVTPTAARDEIELQYCVVLPGSPGSTDAMGLSGRRAVGAELDDLGEFAFDAESIRVEASAWLLEGAGA